MEPQEQEYPHCDAPLPDPRTGPDVIHVVVSYLPPTPATPGTWAASLSPIQLQNDDDEVVWDLTAIWAMWPKAAVRIRFLSGPPPLDPDRGPHKMLSMARPNAHGQQRHHNWGCYSYVFEVDESGAGQQYAPLSFIVDPQIDNLPPPTGERGPGSHEGEHGRRSKAKPGAREGHEAAGRPAGSRTRKSGTSSARHPSGGRRAR